MAHTAMIRSVQCERPNRLVRNSLISTGLVNGPISPERRCGSIKNISRRSHRCPRLLSSVMTPCERDRSKMRGLSLRMVRTEKITVIAAEMMTKRSGAPFSPTSPWRPTSPCWRISIIAGRDDVERIQSDTLTMFGHGWPCPNWYGPKVTTVSRNTTP